MQLTQDVLGRPPARLLGHRAQLGQRSASFAGRDVRDVADGVDTRVARRRSGPGSTSRRPPRPGEGPAVCATAEPDSPPPQTTVRAEMVLPSSNSTVGVDRGDADPQPDVRAGLGQLLQGVLVGLARRTAPSRASPAVDDGDLARLRRVARSRAAPASARPTLRWSRPRSGRRRRRRRRACRLAALRIVDCRLQEPLEVQPQPLGVGHRVQRERVLRRAGHSEEVRPGTRRHHQVRPRAASARRTSAQAACGQVRRSHLRGHHLDRRVCSLKMVRWGRAMSSAGSWELATW